MATSRTLARAITQPRDTGGARRRRLGVAMVITLLAQAVLGVANELWTTVPQDGDPFTGAVPQWLLTVHVLVGTLAVMLAIAIVVSALRAHDTAWSTPAVVGLATVLGAWLSGHFFLVTYGADALSMSMAVLAMLAIGTYVVGLVRSTGVAERGTDVIHEGTEGGTP